MGGGGGAAIAGSQAGCGVAPSPPRQQRRAEEPAGSAPTREPALQSGRPRTAPSDNGATTARMSGISKTIDQTSPTPRSWPPPDPRTTEHYGRARDNLRDRHGVHFLLTAYVGSV